MGMFDYIKTAELYGVSFGYLINRETYKGKGRPKKTDYITIDKAQRQLNKRYSEYLDILRSKLLEE